LKKRWLGLVGGALVSALLAGCGPNAGDRIIDVREDILLLGCECPELLSGTPEECMADVLAAQPSEAERACIRRIYDRNESALDPSASCTLDAANDYEACVVDARCDEALLRACDDAFDLANRGCPAVPDDLQAQLLACFT
jgi:hypothetical protein